MFMIQQEMYMIGHQSPVVQGPATAGTYVVVVTTTTATAVTRLTAATAILTTATMTMVCAQHFI